MPVVRGIEFADWAERPSSLRNRGLSFVECSSATGRNRQFLRGGVSSSRRSAPNSGCCLILRHTRKASRVGTCGMAQEDDHCCNSFTGIISGPLRIISRNAFSLFAGPG